MEGDGASATTLCQGSPGSTRSWITNSTTTAVLTIIWKKALKALKAQKDSRDCYFISILPMKRPKTRKVLPRQSKDGSYSH